MEEKKTWDDLEFIECSDRAEWLEKRKAFLTASDVAAANGDSPFKTPTELWEEKTGLGKAKDISSSPAVMRGVEREPEIRAAFEKAHSEFKLSYHPVRLYTNGIFAATLDGELTSVIDGARGVLEIKSVGIKGKADLAKWDADLPPVHYLEQTLVQMHVTGAAFCYLVAEFTYEGNPEFQGDLPDRWTKEYFYSLKTPGIAEASEVTISGAAKFFSDYVQTKTPPPTVMNDSENSGEVAVIEADADVGKFYENFDKVKKKIGRMVEPYRNAVFTLDMEKDAKKVHAELKAMADDIDKKRIAVKKKYEAPLKIFEGKANELKKVIEEVRLPIKAQLDSFDASIREDKKRKVFGVIDELKARIIPENLTDLFDNSGGVEFDDKWLNRSCSLSTVSDAVTDKMKAFVVDSNIVMDLAGDDIELQSVLLSEYAKTRNLEKASKAKADYLSAKETARKIAEEKARREKERQEEASRRLEPEPEGIQESPEPEAIGDTDAGSRKKEIRYRFEAVHTEKEEWKALLSYMREHGFRFRRLEG